jgi:Domain of unknown function (DUF1772)
MKALQSVLFSAFFCTTMIVLGGTIFSVMVEYPNWFANVPSSLAATREFYQVLHPGYFFQTFGPLMVLTAIAFIVTGWRIGGARNMVAVSLVLLIAIELLTFLYIYPRLEIMFGPDSTDRSLDALRLAADQFTFADRIRTGMMFVASGFSVVALFRFFSHFYGAENR